MTYTKPADLCKDNVSNTSTNKGHINSCVGIIIIQSTEKNKAIGLYTQYASISSKAKYKFGFYGELSQLFANNFTFKGVI